jgi:tetratricopeptide (TPR) repeat protein
LWPAGLSLFYPYAAGSQLLWQAPLAVSLLAGICAGVLTYWRKHPWLLVGWLWYLGMMVPMIGLVAICPSPYGDRNTYLPQIGVSLLLTWTVADWSARWKYRRMILGGLMAAVLVALTVSACAQTSYWRNNRELWTRVLVCTPGNSIARDNLGAALLKDGQTDDAIAQFRAALKIRPAYPHALYNLGIALARKKEFDQAIAQYRQALAFDPNYVEAWSNLGITLFDKGEVAEAISAYSKALQINPRYPEARYNLGIALFAAGEKGEAIAQYRKALEINPAYAEARYNLANGLLQLGQLEEAITQYRQALATTPDDPRLLNNLGIALAVQGANEEAITQYRKALRINPGFIDAQYDLGLALVKLGKMDEAAAQFRQALDLAVAQKNDRSVAMLEKQIKLCEAASKSPP